MKCPRCKNDMAKGEAAVHGTLGGFMLFGLSHQHLWFFKGHKDELVLPSNQEAAAYRCADCKLTVIDGESYQDQASTNFGRKLGTKYAKWKNRRREQDQ
ncbi:MAG: PF20097 family protein [Verrucomicrobiota bacterium]